MRGWMLVVLALLGAWWGPSGSVCAGTTVEILETYPAGDDVTLGHNQRFYVHLAYSTDKPERIWVRPYLRGEPANVGSHPSRIHTGSGETFGWFFFVQPGDEVDEIRISVGNGGNRTTRVVATLPIHVVGSNGPAAGGAEPTWIGELQQLDDAARAKADEERMNAPVSAGDVVLLNGFMVVMLGLGVLGLAGPVWGIRRWSGNWRLAAWVPVVVMGFVIVRIAVGLVLDPDSHNLWPFEIVMAGAFSAVVMLALLVARKFSGAGR